MQSIFQLAMLLPVTLLGLLWLFLAMRYEEKFQEITSTIDGKEYQMSEILYIGFQVMELLRYDFKSDRARRKIKLMAEVYGKQYAEYHYYVLVGAQITYTLTATAFILPLALLLNEPVWVFVGILLAGLFAWYVHENFRGKLASRRERLLFDFPKVLSKLTLLVNSGMLLREAWKLTAQQGNSILFQEMQKTSLQMDNGMYETAAYHDFGERCGVKEIRKFASMVIQGIEKGGADLTLFLREMSEEMWAEKKNLVKQRGERANAKLLIPTVLIFIGILTMIMAPVLTGL